MCRLIYLLGLFLLFSCEKDKSFLLFPHYEIENTFDTVDTVFINYTGNEKRAVVYRDSTISFNSTISHIEGHFRFGNFWLDAYQFYFLSEGDTLLITPLIEAGDNLFYFPLGIEPESSLEIILNVVGPSKGEIKLDSQIIIEYESRTK